MTYVAHYFALYMHHMHLNHDSAILLEYLRHRNALVK